MRWLRSRKGRSFTFLLAVVVALVAVYAVGAIKSSSTSSPGSSTPTSTAKGAEEANGPASFIGHASNAVMFIQWTRSGSSVAGALREAIAKSSALRLESADRAFTGTVAGKGITLNLSSALGESSAYVGEVKERGFTLTVPGQGSSLITINFEPGEVSGYDAATKELLLAKYPSPCSLYVAGHEVRVSFTGPNSASACASFVQHAAGSTEWTTAPQASAESGSVVCEVQNRDNEKAAIMDNGGQAYGKEACNQLSGEGWG
jgi:hypothetical protein